MPLRKTHVVVTLLLLCATGCYTYRPATTVRPGVDVRVRLNTDAAVRRSAGLDEPIIIYTGRLLQETTDAITLDVLIMRDPSQFRAAEIRETVILERSEIQSLMVRELSTSRSILFAGGVAVAAVAVVTGINAIVGGSEDEGDDGGPQAAVISLFRLQQSGGSIRLQLPFR